ncbi:MAG: RNA methyltransferase [Actinomycetia bacterium]|nr:RNA methyltransferase [Actinomycetes bacterium]
MDALRPLDDLHNKIVRTARHLRESRTARERAGQAVLEGPHLVLDALAAGVRMRAVLYSRRLLDRPDGPALLRRLMGGAVRSVYVTDRVLDHVVDVETHQGIVAVADLTVPLTGTLRGPRVVVANAIQDPGNLGTLIRAAAAFGFRVHLTEGTVDPLNPKSLRASAGGFFRVDLARLRPDWTAEPGLYLVLADPAGDMVYADWDWRRPTALVVGNEGGGIAPEVARRAAVRLAVPMEPGFDSLNAAVAAAVIMADAYRRGRQLPAAGPA